MLLLYGDVIDAIVTLEGFNELVFGQYGAYRYQLENPWEPSVLAAIPSLASRDQLLASSLNSWIYQVSRNHWLLGNSKLFYFVSKSTRDLLRGRAASDSQQQVRQFFEYPSDWSYSDRRDDVIRDHRRYVAMMQAVADEIGIQSAYFIQPVPAIDKDLTPEEQKVVGDLSYKEDYLQMEKTLLALQERGIPIFSLTDIYHDYEGGLYFDPVHQRRKSDGYKIMAERIASTLAAEWGLETQN